MRRDKRQPAGRSRAAGNIPGRERADAAIIQRPAPPIAVANKKADT